MNIELSLKEDQGIRKEIKEIIVEQVKEIVRSEFRKIIEDEVKRIFDKRCFTMNRWEDPIYSDNNLPYEIYVNGKLSAKYQTKELAYKMGMAYHNALESCWKSIGGSTHDLIRPCSVVIKTKYFRSNHGK
jgi:hypothetical protein